MHLESYTRFVYKYVGVLTERYTGFVYNGDIANLLYNHTRGDTKCKPKSRFITHTASVTRRAALQLQACKRPEDTPSARYAVQAAAHTLMSGLTVSGFVFRCTLDSGK